MPAGDGGARSLIDAALASDRLQTAAIWKELRTFLAVAKLGSANKAAAALGTSHTSVTRQLRRLRDVLPDELVIHTKKGAFLTPKGQQLAAALTEVDALLSSTLSRDRARIEATVRVLVTDGVGFVFIVPALGPLTAEHPGIVVAINGPRPYEELRSNAGDIIVAFAEEDTPSDMICQDLGVLHMIPFASRDYVARHGSDLSPDSLRQHRFVGSGRYAGRGPIWRPWRRLVEAGTIACSSEVSITYGVMVKAGLGIGLMPSFNLCEPELVPMRADWSIALPLQAVCLGERLRSRGVRIVWDMLAEALGESQPWLSRDFSLDRRPAAAPPGYARLLNLPG